MSKRKYKLKDSESRCFGLVQGYALEETTYSLVCIDNVEKKDGPFICRTCLSEAIIRKCTEKIDHFAHKARTSNVIDGNNESHLHNQCKNELCNYLKKQFPNGKWEIERPIQYDDTYLIPDISGRINNYPVGIEIQKTPYTIDKIRKKTLRYSNKGVYVLWIVPLKEDLGEDLFRPRLYEKYLHLMYFGKTYYYIVGSKNCEIIPVHYSPAKRFIEHSEFYDDNGDLQTFGGYYLTYKTIKSPNYGEVLNLKKHFSAIERKEFSPKNEKKNIPKCLVFKDDLKRWWEKDEFFEKEKQKELVRDSVFYGVDFSNDEYDLINE